VRAATAEFPIYAALLADYALTVRAAREIEDSEELSQAESRILSRSEPLIAARFGPANALTGIIAAAAEHGQNVAQLSDALGLARSVIVKLDRRLIDATTVPHAAIQRIAAAISCAADDLAAYLNGPPSLAPGASYRAKTAPAIAGESGAVRREAFGTAVAAAVTSGEMKAEQADAWREG
jgi:hypothetical protein